MKLISVADAAKLVGVTKKIVYDATELVPVLNKPRVYRLEDVLEFAASFEDVGNHKRRKRKSIKNCTLG